MREAKLVVVRQVIRGRDAGECSGTERKVEAIRPTSLVCEVGGGKGEESEGRIGVKMQIIKNYLT